MTPKLILAAIPRAGRRIFHRAKYFNTTLQKIGIGVLVWSVPSWVSKGTFWYNVGHWLWPRMKQTYDSELGRLSLLAIGAALAFIP